MKKIVFIATTVAAGFLAGYFLASDAPVVPEKVVEESVAPSAVINQTNVGAANHEYEYTAVARVVDGDTIELADGNRVRYIGIETPELVHPRKPIECFASEAMVRNQELVEGKIVRLERDISDRDRYGRLLRYVFHLADSASVAVTTSAEEAASSEAGGGEWIMVNLKLVEEGYASVATFPPDVKYADEFTAAERRARETGRGLWQVCGNAD